MATELVVLRGTFVVGALLAVAVASITWQHRPKPGATSLSLSMLTITAWIVSFLLASFAASRGATVFWLRLMFSAISLNVVFLFAFSLSFSGNEGWITKRPLAALSLEPLFVTAMVWTNQYHSLFWTEIIADPNAIVGFSRSHGVAHTVHTFVSYLLLAVAMFLVVRHLYRFGATYRAQAGAIVVSFTIPWALNVLYVFGPLAVDLTPVGFVVMGSALAVGVVRYRFIDVTPIARNTVVDSINAAVFVLDREGQCIDVNDRGERMVDTDRDELLGKRPADVVDTHPELADQLSSVSNVPTETEFEYIHAERVFHGEISPLYDSAGRLIGHAYLVQDVTEQRQRERELERRNEQLDQFASLVSHDLRNPLNVASGRLELAETTGDLDHLDDVRGALDRMETIIDDVLTLAREGRSTADTEPLDLATVAEDAWGNVDTDGATLSVTESCPIEADESRLLRLFENLFRNSIEHGARDEDGSSALTVRVGSRKTHGHVTGFFLEDDGVGIPEERRDAVLEPGHSTNDGGTGLGLAIVTSIAEAHGWDVEITESEAGGARFGFDCVQPTPEVDRSEPTDSKVASPVE